VDNPILLPVRVKDISGKNFHRLTVLSYAGVASGRTMWNCRCVCGNPVVASGVGIRRGNPKSCGCFKLDLLIARSTKHGLCKSNPKEYAAWKNMVRRCTISSARNYLDYGGRGITVCQRWLGDDGANNFIFDMGARTSSKHSIDRIDNDGGYWCGKPECPECGQLDRIPNCRWATDSEQQWNKRDSKIVSFDGLSMPVKVWAKNLGISYSTLRRRIKLWPVKRALTEPVRTHSR
jgi:hypothetical protein